MSKRLQVYLSDEAWTAFLGLSKDANQNFKVGFIGYSDLMDEIILTAKIDAKALQLKYTDVGKMLKAVASKDAIDVDALIKNLTDIKSKSGKRTPKAVPSTSEAT